MVVRLGVSLLDLLPQADDPAVFVVDEILERLGVLTVVEHRSSMSEEFVLHSGFLQSLTDVLGIDMSGVGFRIPGVTQGLPFRLALRRGSPRGGGQEEAPAEWTLDLSVSNVEVLLPGLQAARQAGGAGVGPLHLERLQPGRREVFLVAGGVVRVQGGAGTATSVQLIDGPDPFDPTAPTGAVVRLTVRPPHFFLGGSQYGLTIDRLQVDLSEEFTPADVVARGHDETWRGVSFKEATFYPPPDNPVLPNLSIGTRDVIAGNPGGLQGEVRVEWGADFADQFNTHITVLRKNAQGQEVEVARTVSTGPANVLEYGIDLSLPGMTERARAVFGVGDAVPGHTDFGVVGVWWRLPDGTEGNSATTPHFQVPNGGELRYRLRLGDLGTGSPSQAPGATTPSAVPEGQVELLEVVVRFPRVGAPAPPPPLIDAELLDGTVLHGVVHLRGPRAKLTGIRFHARRVTENGEEPVEVDWSLGGGSIVPNATKKPTFTVPKLAEGTGTVDLVARVGGALRRVRVEVVRTGLLVAGHRTGGGSGSPGVVTAVGPGPLTTASIVDTFEAKAFHATGDRPVAAVGAEIAPPNVEVPAGAIAEVELPLPLDEQDPIPPVPPPSVTPVKRGVQLLFEFGEAGLDGTQPVHKVVYALDGDENLDSDPDSSKHVEAARPIGLRPTRSGRSPLPGADVVAQLRQWIQELGTPNHRKYLLVARTDDLRFNATLTENQQYNDGLALMRKDAAVKKLKAAGIAEGDILARIETAAPLPLPQELAEAEIPARFTTQGRLALPPGQVQQPPGATRPVWNSAWNADTTDLAERTNTIQDARREYYRCVDVYAVDEPAAEPPPDPPQDQPEGVPVRVLVPGPDGPPPPKIPSTAQSAPPLDRRVRVRARWDSPTYTTPADAVPTEVEILVAWKAAQTELPATSTSGGAPGALAIPKPTGPDFWELVLRLAYDARTEQTQVDGALSLPDGAMLFRSDALAGALAFGPAFVALIDPADVSDGVGVDDQNKVVYAAALLAAGAFVGELLNSGDGPESTVDIDKFAISYRWNGESRVSATVDYTVDLRIDVDLPGGSFLFGRIKLRYKGVGLRFDSSQSGLASVGVTYDGLSVEVADPGQWSLGGPLGNLIRVAASRIGNGSTWMELDLEFALDLGVVRLEGATVRITLDPFSVELRGLTAVIDVPGVVRGKGSVTVGEAGAIRALLGVEIIPAKLGAYGALAVDQDFVAVEVGVQFPVGIPLAGTGLGLYGLMGRFVANGARDLTGLTNPDPVQRELDWYSRPPDQRYARRSGQFAMGLGAVIGTLPDSAFTFNAEGAIALGFPDVSVLLGINARLLQQRKMGATESAQTPAGGLRILGMALFEGSSVLVAARANYEIPKVVRIHAPFSAFYPTASGDAWFIRLGTDNHPERPGSPVTVTIFPGLLNVKAWAFVMVEERRLHGLGGTLVPTDLVPQLDFDGYSVGLGAGFEYRKKAGPFKLEIAAFLLVGVGTKPMLFAGAAGVRGELDLKVASVGVDGLVHFQITKERSYLHGHFCGKVSFCFFSVKGCVDVHLGDEAPTGIPKPGSPLAGVDLCDHLSAVKAKASASPVGAVPTVWPDTVAVLKFEHYVQDALGAPPAAQFRRRVAPPAALSPWSGSTELKYAFRLVGLRLFRLTGGNPHSDASWTPVTGPFDSAWWMPSHRRAVITGGTGPGPSTEEGRELGLFHWDPRAWSRWLGEGSQDLPGDPAGGVGEMCEEPAPAEPSCALGREARSGVGALAVLDAVPGPGAVFPSRFSVAVRPGAGFDPEEVAALAGDAGWTYLPGAVAPLHGSADVHGEKVKAGWRLPSLWNGDRFVLAAPTRLDLSKPLLRGEVLIEVCLAKEMETPRPTGACDRMPREPEELTGFLGESGAEYHSPEPMLVAEVDGVQGLDLRAAMYGLGPRPVDTVRVELLVKETAKVLAFDEHGEVVAAETARWEERPGERVSVTLQAAGITRIGIEPEGATIVVLVCWGADEQPLVDEVANLPVTDLPVLVGVTRDGDRVKLEAKAIPAAAGSDRDSCPKFVYPFDDLGSGADDGWTSVEIEGFRRGEVSLVSVCGVTVEARQAQSSDGEFRGSLVNLFSELVGHLQTDQPTREIQLQASTTYQIRATWEYQGFRPDEPGDEPPPPSGGGWLAGGTDRFTFRTAAFGTAPAPLPAGTASLETDPAQGGPGYDERVFDPRGLARYVMASAPGREAPPHFLDDPVGFWFSVDHLASLLDQYDRVPLVKVLRTDPPGGSMHEVPAPPPGDRHPLDVTVATRFALETLTWYPADHRLVTAVEEAPCVGAQPPIGSSSVSVDADLQPGHEYDLLLTVAPQVVGAHPETVVARGHFRTSRYRDPAELIGALGFRDPVGPAQPFDAIAAGPLPPPAAAAVSDDLLDGFLGQLGLDPWPLPAGPRTSVVWGRPAQQGDPWTVLGVLVEADEPVARPGFATGAVGEPAPPPRLELASLVVRRTTEQQAPSLPGSGLAPSVISSTSTIGTLAERVRNAAGTRVLFLAPAPIALTGGLAYDLRLTTRERGGAGAAGSIPLYDRPLMIFQEGE